MGRLIVLGLVVMLCAIDCEKGPGEYPAEAVVTSALPAMAPENVPRTEPGGSRPLCAYWDRPAPDRPVAFYGDCVVAIRAGLPVLVVRSGSTRGIVQ